MLYDIVHLLQNVTLSFISFAGIIVFTGLFNIDTLNKFSFFPGSIMKSRILETTIFDKHGKNILKDCCETICNWALKHKLGNSTSCHWWLTELPKDIQIKFDNIGWNLKVKTLFETLFSPDMYDILQIHEMNELYITSEKCCENSSDNIFFTPHIDGPFSFMPFVSVYRGIISLNNNSNISTYFPMTNGKTKLNKGDAVFFDFNREIHYIEKDSALDVKYHGDHNDTEKNDEYRITMKTHYCIFPKSIAILGKAMIFLNIAYDRLFRNIFLYTINPISCIKKRFGDVVILSSKLFVYSDLYVGHKNILYILFWSYILPNGLCDLTFLLLSTMTFFTKLFIAHFFYSSIIHDDNVIEMRSFQRDLCVFMYASLYSFIFLVFS